MSFIGEPLARLVHVQATLQLATMVRTVVTGVTYLPDVG